MKDVYFKHVGVSKSGVHNNKHNEGLENRTTNLLMNTLHKITNELINEYLRTQYLSL